MFNSVRVRLTLWYVGVFGLLLISFSIIVYVPLSRSLYERVDHSLSNAARATATELENELGESNGDAKYAAAETLHELQLPDTWTAIFDGSELLASNLSEDQLRSLRESLLAAVDEENRPSFRTIDGFGEEGGREVVLSISVANGHYIVAVIQPLHDLVEQIEAIRRLFYIGFPATLLIAGLGGFLLARKSLSPVVEMSAQATRIGATNLQQRLKVSNPRDELGRLADAFNELLSRLNSSFENMRGFMADASHELRTPLSVIRGEADVALAQDRDANEYRETLTIIQDEARRLSRIVDDMMALARADAGEHRLKLQTLYLNDLVEEACRAMRMLAVRKGVSLTLEPAEDVTFNGDEDLLRRLVMNLLDNAIKYTPPGGSVMAKIACDKDTVKIIVSDTGIGIPADAAPHVFERFYRVDGARSRADGGSGLGLAIARWVAEAHKGSIDLDSSPGRGSKFTVSLAR